MVTHLVRAAGLGVLLSVACGGQSTADSNGVEAPLDPSGSGAVASAMSGAGGGQGRAEGGTTSGGAVDATGGSAPSAMQPGSAGTNAAAGSGAGASGGTAGASCAPASGDSANSPGGAAGGAAVTDPDPAPGASAYPKRGFVVHEWGTNTVVSGSNGSLQAGLHHEEEDLPGFVYDRLKAATARPEIYGTAGGIDVKMETPVLYFYADRPLTVHASVSFPSGTFTQWYPGVARFMPPAVMEGSVDAPTYRDVAEDPALTNPSCLSRYQLNGLLDWGAFELLTEAPAPETLKPAPLEEYTWSHARNVAANAVRFPDGETEGFLFYRGLSNVALPATTRANGGGSLTLENLTSAALGSVFVVDVQGETGAFAEYPAGVAATASLALEVPSEAEHEPLDEFTLALATAVTGALDRTGLYHDEAVAMVSTWQRQWFKTPGLRVFYLAPQAWTDSVLPLTLDPIPDSLVRVMMVRVEVLTPELEASDAAAVELFASDSAAARAHFDGFGRFAEPRLRRALELVPSSAGDAYLAALEPGFERSSGTGE